jgi:hypothetical protein
VTGDAPPHGLLHGPEPTGAPRPAAPARGPLVRLASALGSALPDDPRLLPAFLWAFAAYLAIRGLAYEDLRLLLPCAALLPFDRTRRLSALAAIVVEAALIREHAALLSNHGFLETWLLAVVAAVDARGERPEGRRALVRALALALVIVVLWTGVQKCLHGYFLDGTYFEFELAQRGKLAERMAWILPAAEEAELARHRDALAAWARAAPAGAFDAPPPRPAALAVLSRAACWSTLAAELFLPLALLVPRLRAAAALLLAAFFFGVELAADEWHFAMLVAALLLLFAPAERMPWARAAAASDAGADAPGPLPRATLAAWALLFAGLLLWPPLQHHLSRTAGLNPWKLGGFAMYAVPGWSEWSRVEVRGAAGDLAWRPFDRRAPGAPRAPIALAEATLKNCPFEPFASRAVQRIAALVRAHIREPRAHVRVRSRVLRHDRSLGRFVLEERVYEAPPPAAPSP